MNTLLYICEQRVLQIDLQDNDWTIRQEYKATDQGFQELSDWLRQQRWLSVSVILDFTGVSWTNQPLPTMSLYNRLRFVRAQKRDMRDTGAWWRVTTLQPSRGYPQGSLTRLCMQESGSDNFWKPLLDTCRHKINAVYPAVLLVEAQLLPPLTPAERTDGASEDTLVCARCSDQHCWHLYGQNGVLQYVRVLPFLNDSAGQLQQIQETLHYMQDESASSVVKPALLLADDFAHGLARLREGLDSQLVSKVLTTVMDDCCSSATSAAVAESGITKTQLRLFDQFANRSAATGGYRLSSSGGFSAHYRAVTQLLVRTPVLCALNLLLFLLLLAGLSYGHASRNELEKYRETAAQLTQGISHFPIPAQQMRDTVLLHENLLAGRPDPVSMLIHLAQAVSSVPGLMLKRVEWLVDDRSAENPAQPLEIALVAEPYRTLRIDEESKTEILVRFTGQLSLEDASVSKSYAQYRAFTQVLSNLQGVRLLADQVPFDSATPTSISNDLVGKGLAEFSVLLSVGNFAR